MNGSPGGAVCEERTAAGAAQGAPRIEVGRPIGAGSECLEQNAAAPRAVCLPSSNLCGCSLC